MAVSPRSVFIVGERKASEGGEEGGGLWGGQPEERPMVSFRFFQKRGKTSSRLTRDLALWTPIYTEASWGTALRIYFFTFEPPSRLPSSLLVRRPFDVPSSFNIDNPSLFRQDLPLPFSLLSLASSSLQDGFLLLEPLGFRVSTRVDPERFWIDRFPPRYRSASRTRFHPGLHGSNLQQSRGS